MTIHITNIQKNRFVVVCIKDTICSVTQGTLFFFIDVAVKGLIKKRIILTILSNMTILIMVRLDA